MKGFMLSKVPNLQASALDLTLDIGDRIYITIVI